MPLPRRRGGGSSPNLVLLAAGASAAAVVVGAAAFAAWRRRTTAASTANTTAPSTRVNSSGFLNSWLGVTADSSQQATQHPEGTPQQQQPEQQGSTATASGVDGGAAPKATLNGGPSTPPKVSSPEDSAGPGPLSTASAAASVATTPPASVATPTTAAAAAVAASSPVTPASARRRPPLQPPLDSPSSAALSPPGVSSESVVSPSAVRARVRRAEGEASPVWVTAAAWGSPLSGAISPGASPAGAPTSGGRETKRPRRGPAVAARVAAVAAAEAEAEARSGSPARAPRPSLAIPSSPRFTIGKPFVFGSTPSAATPRASSQPFGRPSDAAGDAFTPGRPSSGGASVSALRRSFSATRPPPAPQPEIFCVESPLPAVLQAQYGSGASALHERISVLAERHCEKLMDITGELGEPTALDVGCMAGALTFCMASSFRHVLGIEADAQLILAAKELKEVGELEYAVEGDGGEEVMRTAVVDPDIDRDRVRFWHCPALPSLPPKLAPVDAVVIEDGHGRIHRGLARLLDQVPAALNPRGICVVALPASGALSPRAPPSDGEDGSCSGADVESVKRRMAALGLELVHEESRPLPSSAGGASPAAAPAAAVLLVWKAPGVGQSAVPA